jgi:hypothetical protein
MTNEEKAHAYHIHQAEQFAAGLDVRPAEAKKTDVVYQARVLYDKELRALLHRLEGVERRQRIAYEIDMLRASLYDLQHLQRGGKTFSE